MAIILSTVAAVAQEKKAQRSDSRDQEDQEIPLDLLEREPFWELTLDAANDNKVFEIAPPEEDVDIPEDPQPGDRLRIRLLDAPGQEYRVEWRHIARLRTYEQMVFEEARRLTRQDEYQEAFRYFEYLERTYQGLRDEAQRLSRAGKDEAASRYFDRLKRDFPDRSELEHAILEYLLKNADDLIREEEYRYALGLLQEVVRRDETYRAAEVATRISEVADRLITAEVERENYANARGMITRLESQYGRDRLEVLGRWRDELMGQARTLRRQVEKKMEQEEYRSADRLSRRMVRIWPDLSGADELRAEIARRYPMVIVGVAEAADQQDVNSMSHWARRRTGALTQRTLVRFLGAGPEGGQYLCPHGEYYQSDDRRQLTLQLAQLDAPDRLVRVDGYDVSRGVLKMADPESSLYKPNWASLIEGTRVEDVFKVHVLLRRPHVLPEAMLQFQLDHVNADRSNALGPGEGPYRKVDETDGDGDDAHFVANSGYPFPGTEHFAEIVERRFETSEDALAALRRGEIDVIDYLFPGDVGRLRDEENQAFQVLPYSLPTIHVLVPSNENPFTANPVFRRALLYGINRKKILENEVLGNQPMAGCQLISGPFPIGTGKHDPLSYAYNEEIEPRGYYPRLALVLKTLAHRTLRKMAETRNEKIPSEIKLKIGYPGNEAARVACQAISRYLEVVGIECQLVDLSKTQASDIDLRYMQVAMWEPVIDARRLLAPAGVGGDGGEYGGGGSEYVGMALRRLDAASNWREVRTRLRRLHRIAHEQVPVLPLWQTVDHMAHSRRLAGIGSSPLTLYQDVEQWRVVKGETSGEAESKKK
ncbi:MAG: ABC transporter substrate-binding protein [Planctomycetota bacterium]